MTSTHRAIARAERLIVALDVPSAAEARALVERLGDAVSFYKVGLELFSVPGCFELVSWLTGRGHKVFADLKLHDIPETVRRAVANLRGCGATFLTVHGHRSVMQAAAREKGDLKILAVTVLTSFDQRDLEEVGSAKSIEDLVLARARGAVETGCDGVIASGLEAGDPPGRQQTCGRPEAHSRRAAGVRRRRRLHRGGAADPRGSRSARRGGIDPADHRYDLSSDWSSRLR